MTLERLTEQVWQRLLPRVLLVGEAPGPPYQFHYVRASPWEAIFLGKLSPELLLAMPTDVVCRALLIGQPVLLWNDQPHRRAVHGVLLKRELEAAQARLLRLGVTAIGPGTLYTEKEIRQIQRLIGEDAAWCLER